MHGSIRHVFLRVLTAMALASVLALATRPCSAGSLAAGLELSGTLGGGWDSDYSLLASARNVPPPKVRTVNVDNTGFGSVVAAAAGPETQDGEQGHQEQDLSGNTQFSSSREPWETKGWTCSREDAEKRGKGDQSFFRRSIQGELVDVLGEFPLPVEVIPMARSYIARELVKLGGRPVWRDKFVTDNGNIILDIHNLEIMEPVTLEEDLNNIPGIVTVGLFARRPADVLLLGTEDGVRKLT